MGRLGVVLKIFFACFVGGAWYHLNGPEQAPIAIVLFVLIIFASFIKPIRFQDPEQRDEYRHQIQEAKERRRLIAEKQMEEKRMLRNKDKIGGISQSSKIMPND